MQTEVKDAEKEKLAAMQIVVNTYRHLYEALEHKIHSYYREELVLRGDRNLNKEYCRYFGMEQ